MHLLLALCLAFSGGVKPLRNDPPSKIGILVQTNLVRTQNGAQPLTYNQHLEHSARRHAEDMAAHGYFSHDSLDGRTFWDRIKATPYTPRAGGVLMATHSS